MNEPNMIPEPNIDSAFLNLLQMIRKGQVITDMSEKTREVIAAVRREGKPGAVALIIKFSPSGYAGGLEFADDIQTKVPKPKRPVTFAFVDEDGNLHRNDPNQKELPLREIAGGVVDVTELKSVTQQATA